MRPTYIKINQKALLHNVNYIKQLAPKQKIMAMVKANAYGCGMNFIVPILDNVVDFFGVACTEEALEIRNLGSNTACLLLEGVFSKDELQIATAYNLQCVIHQYYQLEWLLEKALPKKIVVWIKIDTGMGRLGFNVTELTAILNKLQQCPWVVPQIGIMSHFACADVMNHHQNTIQINNINSIFTTIDKSHNIFYSIANSATILNFPAMHVDIIRPGIMLYGVSPSANHMSSDYNLKPVMSFFSAIISIHNYPAGVSIGYGSTWKTTKPTTVAIVAAGYGDGYPRHINPNTLVAINHEFAPIVGTISMDMLAIDITLCNNIRVGDKVELWGNAIPIETVANAAGTIAYELMCQITTRNKRIQE